jgi:hypothetical protein
VEEYSNFIIPLQFYFTKTQEKIATIDTFEAEGILMEYLLLVSERAAATCLIHNVKSYAQKHTLIQQTANTCEICLI